MLWFSGIKLKSPFECWSFQMYLCGLRNSTGIVPQIPIRSYLELLKFISNLYESKKWNSTIITQKGKIKIREQTNIKE